MNLSAVENDQTLLERINPVLNTAKMTLFQLAHTGDEDAARIVEKLGLTKEGTQGDTLALELLCNAFVIETRFRTMGALAEETGLTEVDLPCGYTPRAIQFSRKGIGFLGLDLPAAVSEAAPVITELVDSDKRHLVRFEGVDATNYESLEKAFEKLPGAPCITTEGLLMYFTDSEAGQLCDNIRRLLDRFGGCWITADPETANQYALSLQAIYGERYMDIIRKEQKRIGDRSDVNIVFRTLVIDPRNAVEGTQKAMQFLARHGLQAERLIVGEHAPALRSLDMLTDEQRAAAEKILNQFAYWKITPLEGKTVETEGPKGKLFDLKAELAGDELKLALYGRVDTLTAPDLLTSFEKISGENAIRGVAVDCGSLEYISSAGLRVLLIMHKACENGVTLKNVNRTVREILEQTGFWDIFGIDG